MNLVAICLSFTKYYNFACSWYSKSVATRLNKSRSFTTHALRQVASQVRREQTRGRHSISYFPRKSDFYRPQTKFAKVCFHRCLSVHWGGCPIACWDTQPPLGRHHPPGQTPPCTDTPLGSACWNTVNKLAVRIPLEYILVDKLRQI